MYGTAQDGLCPFQDRSSSSYGCRVKAVASDIRPDEDLPASEIELLLAHSSYGCLSLTLQLGKRQSVCPFVFMPRKKFGLVPFAYLAYCR